MEPVQWPVGAAGKGTPRLFTDGRFQTPDGRARLIPVRPAGPASATDAAFPMSLNNGRIRDQWHTMTRTGLAPDLCRHAPEPFVEIHPEDAAPLGVNDGALARVTTARGEAVVLARVSDRQRPGSLFMPIHWTDAFAPAGRSNGLIAPNLDPVSGQPEFKHTPARIRPWRETWKGFLLTAEPLAPGMPVDVIWRRIPQAGCQQFEFAGRGDEAERDAVRKLASRGAQGEALVYEDARVGSIRLAWVAGDRLTRVLFMTTSGTLPPRDWLIELFDGPLASEARATLLFGRPPGPVIDAGPMVCACLRVGARAIDAAIAAGAASVDAVSATTGAGTNCGSCRPELVRMITAKRETAHAA